MSSYSAEDPTESEPSFHMAKSSDLILVLDFSFR